MGWIKLTESFDGNTIYIQEEFIISVRKDEGFGEIPDRTIIETVKGVYIVSEKIDEVVTALAFTDLKAKVPRLINEAWKHRSL